MEQKDIIDFIGLIGRDSAIIEIFNEWHTCDCGWTANTEYCSTHGIEECPNCEAELYDMDYEYQMHCSECDEYWMSDHARDYICECCGAEG